MGDMVDQAVDILQDEQIPIELSLGNSLTKVGITSALCLI